MKTITTHNQANWYRTNVINIIDCSFNGAAGQLTALKAQFGRDFNSQSSYYQGQISQRRKEGYGIAAVFGPIGLAIAAAVLEGKLVPELNAKIRNVQNFYDDIDRIVAAASVGIDQTKENLKNEVRKIGNLKEATEAASTFIALDYVVELRATIVESAENLMAKCIEYMRSQKQIQAV